MEQEAYIGNVKQINGVNLVKFLQGKAAGMKAYHVYTEAGLSALVSIDRGMDIDRLSVNGINIGFMSMTGLVNSNYFVEDGARGFMRNFTAGFLTTGGLSYMGKADDIRGLHGVISNTPSENYSYKIDGSRIIIYADVREVEMFSSNLVMHRRIIFDTKKLAFKLEDTIENQGIDRTSLMLLYHNNYGYPFLDENINIDMDIESSSAREGVSVADWDKFIKPQKHIKEKVFFHKLRNNTITIKNKRLNLSVKIIYSKETLPIINQWNLMKAQNYVLGIEPGTNTVEGYKEALRKGELLTLENNEKKKFILQFEFETLG